MRYGRRLALADATACARGAGCWRAQGPGYAAGGCEDGGDELAGGVGPGGDDDRQCGYDVGAGSPDRRGDGGGNQLYLAIADGVAVPPDLGQLPPQPGRADDRVLGEFLQRLGEYLLDEIRVGVSEQDPADPGDVQGQACAGAGDDRRGVVAEDPLHVDDFGAVEYRYLHVLMGDFVQVFQERECGFSQALAAGCERSDLPQMQPDAVSPALVSLHRAPSDQLMQLAVGR